MLTLKRPAELLSIIQHSTIIPHDTADCFVKERHKTKRLENYHLILHDLNTALELLEIGYEMNDNNNVRCKECNLQAQSE